MIGRIAFDERRSTMVYRVTVGGFAVAGVLGAALCAPAQAAGDFYGAAPES
ncbi:hypothetical protein [Nocardia sp. NPDC049526]|uniref:hypothetical protein n=1 Tax=Nocardia sp. NPDC049526 TaxID=3364316 RepID=UPI00379F554A